MNRQPKHSSAPEAFGAQSRERRAQYASKLGNHERYQALTANKVFGWVVTVTTPGPAGATGKVWYAACPEKVAAVEAVRLVTDNSGAIVQISREMSETLMTAFGLTIGQVKCFD